MKLSKIKLIRYILPAVIALISITATAQTNQNLYLQNGNGRLFRYGYQGFLTTADGSAHTIATFLIGANEGGVLTARVVGVDTATMDEVTGVVGIRYKKVAGTLTLGSAINVQSIVTDAGLGSATFAFAASSNNVVLNVTGDASTSVVWKAEVMWTNIKKSDY
jgi:hypothetical protein